MTNTARVYQLEHGHTQTATLIKSNGDKIQFLFGYPSSVNTDKMMYVHGIQGGSTTRTIETVQQIPLAIGDVVQFDNKCGRVENFSMVVLDKTQLRFNSFDKVDKIINIALQNISIGEVQQ